VELGALVVTQGSHDAQPTDNCTLPVLGKTVLDRWVERVQGLGINLLSVVDGDVLASGRLRTMVDWAKQGVDQILLILLGSYSDVDLLDVVRFHHEGQHRITRVFDPVGPLGISLLDREAILNSNREARKLAPMVHSTRYDFLGYSVRLSSPGAYRKLVEDALQGRCDVKPNGVETERNIWIHPAACIDPSVRLEGSCYVGAYARLNPGVVLRDGSSVEHNCDIDIGTTLDHASILPNTYVAPGLWVRNSIIDGIRLENLDRGISVALGSLGLSKRKKPISGYSSAPSVVRNQSLDAASFCAQLANAAEDLGSTSSQVEANGQ
jgi:NDP-sugar pyrophosphorylase family protein